MTDELISKAKETLKNSYSPYSEFQVGAAVLCDDGTVFCGVNVENASYSATICAERTAFLKALSEGKRRFSAIAVVGGKHGEIKEFCVPCGVCLQFMSEFCSDDFKIILFDGKRSVTYRLSEVLPNSFNLKE